MFEQVEGVAAISVERRHKMLGVVLAVVAGVAIAAQAGINGKLATEIDDAMLAAVISFSGGLVVLAVLLVCLPGMRAGIGNVGSAMRSGSLRPWHLLGGIGGAGFVASQATTVSVVGVAMFTVSVVAGQTVSGLFVDKAGLGPAGPRPITPQRLLGAGLMLVAVVVTTWGGLAAMGTDTWLLVFPVLGGLAVAVQQAINGRVGAAADNALTATLVNFVVGTVALVIGWLIALALRGFPQSFPSNPFLYLGGLVGVAFIAMAALVVRWVGVLLLGLASIAGQLVGSLLHDLHVPTHANGLAPATVIGVVLSMVAIGVATAPGGRA